MYVLATNEWFTYITFATGWSANLLENISVSNKSLISLFGPMDDLSLTKFIILRWSFIII